MRTILIWQQWTWAAWVTWKLQITGRVKLEKMVSELKQLKPFFFPWGGAVCGAYEAFRGLEYVLIQNLDTSAQT